MLRIATGTAVQAWVPCSVRGDRRPFPSRRASLRESPSIDPPLSEKPCLPDLGTYLPRLPSHFPMPHPHLRTWKQGREDLEPNRIAGRVMMIPCGLNPEIWRRGRRVPLSTQDRKGKELPKATAGHNLGPPKQAAAQVNRKKPSRPLQVAHTSLAAGFLVCAPSPNYLRCSISCLISLREFYNSPCCNGHLHLLLCAQESRTNPGEEKFLGSIQDPRLHLACTSPAHLTCIWLHLACTPRRPSGLLIMATRLIAPLHAASCLGAKISKQAQLFETEIRVQMLTVAPVPLAESRMLNAQP